MLRCFKFFSFLNSRYYFPVIAFFVIIALLFSLPSQAAVVEQYYISSIKMERTADGFELKISGESQPTYTIYELFSPLRIILDIADAAFAENLKMFADLPLGPVNKITKQILDEQKPFIARIEVVLSADYSYSVERQGHDIVIMFAENRRTHAVESSQKTVSDTSTARNSSPFNQKALMLHDIQVDKSSPAETLVFLKTDGPVAIYKKAHLPKAGGKPDRMYIDLSGVTLLSNRLLPQEVGTTSLASIRAAQRNGAVRIVFDSNLQTLFAYNITKKPKGLLVTISEPSAATALIADIIAKEEKKERPRHDQVTITLSGKKELINPIIPDVKPIVEQAVILNAATKKKIPAKNEHKEQERIAKESLLFAGYQKQRITVDFFKIDLHNVFRLFGEISGKNMVVDEAVRGSLSLALNDVPWDFALDIILNLKDLQKEERFNTIVISPGAKEFIWPDKTTDQITFRPDGSVATLEAISVTERLKTPEVIVEAKKLIRLGTMKEQEGDYRGALLLYEQAFSKWRHNAELAERIASICLVQLGMNAKAIHYARASLKVDPDNHAAALYGAIALANMLKPLEAKEYFDQAISGERPASYALLSYAAFAEKYKSYNAALALLAKHNEVHGATLDSMIAQGRIYDKQGERGQAVQLYRTILRAGFELPADLLQYLNRRIDNAE